MLSLVGSGVSSCLCSNRCLLKERHHAHEHTGGEGGSRRPLPIDLTVGDVDLVTSRDFEPSALISWIPTPRLTSPGCGSKQVRINEQPQDAKKRSRSWCGRTLLAGVDEVIEQRMCRTHPQAYNTHPTKAPIASALKRTRSNARPRSHTDKPPTVVSGRRYISGFMLIAGLS